MLRLTLLAAAFIVLVQPPPAPKDKPLEQIKLPPGFAIEVFAPDVPNARQMALGDKGTVFVGSRTAGRVYALEDRNGDLTVDDIHTIATGLAMPSGLAFRGGALYVAEISRVTRYD